MKVLTLSAAIVICGFAAAHAETALSLTSRCTGMTGKANINLCYGQISGMVNGLRDNPAYCNPKSAGGQTVVPIVQKYLLDHPEDGRLDADEAVGKAMSTAYPCPIKA